MLDKPLIVSEFLPKDMEDELESVLLGDSFPWFLNRYTVDGPSFEQGLAVKTPTTYDTNQFTHGFVQQGLGIISGGAQYVLPILNYLKDATGINGCDDISKVKANLTLPANLPLGAHSVPHVDVSAERLDSLDCYTCIYYVNDSDGDTIIYNQKYGEEFTELTELMKITPKKGSMVCFDARHFHAGSNPITTQARSVINLNFSIAR